MKKILDNKIFKFILLLWAGFGAAYCIHEKEYDFAFLNIAALALFITKEITTAIRESKN